MQVAYQFIKHLKTLEKFLSGKVELHTHTHTHSFYVIIFNVVFNIQCNLNLEITFRECMTFLCSSSRRSRVTKGKKHFVDHSKQPCELGLRNYSPHFTDEAINVQKH